MALAALLSCDAVASNDGDPVDSLSIFNEGLRSLGGGEPTSRSAGYSTRLVIE